MKKIIIIVLAIVVLGTGAYLGFKNMQKNNTTTVPSVPSTSQTTTPSVSNQQNVSDTKTTTPAPATTSAPVTNEDKGIPVAPAPKTVTNPAPAPAPTPIAPKTYTVNIASFSFSPATITINKGDTIVWKNNDSVSHQIAGNGFGSSIITNGQSYSFKFDNAGTYDYYCSIHPSMKGKITVK